MSLLEIQSWWEIPCISHFCSLFGKQFNLPEFTIEEFETALFNDERVQLDTPLDQLLPETLSPAHPYWLVDLVVRLVVGCIKKPRSTNTWSDYQQFLRTLFKKRCQVIFNVF